MFSLFNYANFFLKQPKIHEFILISSETYAIRHSFYFEIKKEIDPGKIWKKINANERMREVNLWSEKIKTWVI